MKKKLFALGLATVLTLGLLGGCAKNEVEPTPSPSAPPVESPLPTETPVGEKTQVNLAVLSGPSGIGAVKLMADDEAGIARNDYNITVAGANDEITAGLISGSLDAAAVASNVAAVLYNKTEGGVQVAAVTGLGVLYILENGDSVKTVGDLERRTLYATGQGANPEYVLNHLLAKSGVEPTDVDIRWATAEEVSAKMASGEADLCMLPVPAATGVLMKNDAVRQALDLSAEWDAVESGSRLTQTVLVVRTEFAEENPQAVASLLEEYGASIQYVNENPKEAAGLVAGYGITPNAAVAEAAIPQCNLVFLSGVEEMRDAVQGFYETMWKADPKSVGGSVPDDGFYYGR